MAKTATTSTLPPELFALGREVFFEDARAVCEMLNFALTTRPLAHVSLACGDDLWGGAGTIQTLKIKFLSSAGWQERLRFRIKVPVETVEVRVSARCWVELTANTVQVRVTVGAAAAVTMTNFTLATNGAQHTNVITLAATGYQDVLVELNHSVGSCDSFLRAFSLEEVPLVASTLASPAND